jgi:hypothetical protein
MTAQLRLPPSSVLKKHECEKLINPLPGRRCTRTCSFVSALRESRSPVKSPSSRKISQSPLARSPSKRQFHPSSLAKSPSLQKLHLGTPATSPSHRQLRIPAAEAALCLHLGPSGCGPPQPTGSAPPPAHPP